MSIRLTSPLSGPVALRASVWALLALAPAMLAACGDDDDDSAGTDTAADTAGAGGTTGTGDTASTDTASTTTSDGTGDDGGDTTAQTGTDSAGTDSGQTGETAGTGDDTDGGTDGPVEPAVNPCIATEGDILCVGAATKSIAPEGFELPNPNYLSDANDDQNPKRCPVASPCGTFRDDFLDDCGFDGICPANPAYTTPDADGSERDRKPDWFFDCGFDQKCPGDPGYTAPDFGEGNGKFDGLWIPGFSNNRPVRGVADDVSVRSLVYNHKDDTVAYFVIDTIGWFYDDFERIKAKYAEKYPAEYAAIDYFYFQSTHSHSAFDTMGQWGLEDPASGLPSETGIRPWFMDYIMDQAVEAVHEAWTNQKRAEAYYAEILTGVDQLLEDWRPPTVIDDKLQALQFKEEGTEKVIATAIHWVNHPESVWTRSNYASADFPHFIRKFMETGLPARGALPAEEGYGGIGIYMQGAVGGMMSTPGRSTFRDGTVVEQRGREMAEVMGEKVALKAREALANPTRLGGFDGIRFVPKVHYLKLDNSQFRYAFTILKVLPTRQVYNGEGVPYKNNLLKLSDEAYIRTEQAIVRIGSQLTFYTYPNEVFPEFLIGGYDGSRLCGRAGDTGCGYEFIEAARAGDNPPDVTKAPAGPYTEELVPGKYRIALGLAFDELGYMVPMYDFKLNEDSPYFDEAPGSHYEETNSIGPQAATTDDIMRALITDAAKLYPAK